MSSVARGVAAFVHAIGLVQIYDLVSAGGAAAATRYNLQGSATMGPPASSVRATSVTFSRPHVSLSAER